MGGCMSADPYGPDVRQYGANLPAHRARGSGVAGARAHGSRAAGGPPRRKTGSPTFRFNQTLKRAYPRRAASATAAHAPQSATALSTRAMMDDDIGDLIGGRETNFYERGSGHAVHSPPHSPQASQAPPQLPPRRENGSRTPPAAPPRRRATERAPDSALSFHQMPIPSDGELRAQQQQQRKSVARRRRAPESDEGDSADERERRRQDNRASRKRTSRAQPRKSAARRHARGGADDEADDASSAATGSSAARRSGSRGGSERSREADPTLRKLTGQTRYNSDGPMGKSWDRVQAVIQRRSNERGSQGRAFASRA